MRGAVLALLLARLLSLSAVGAFWDGDEGFDPGPARAPAARVIESRWRRPEGCEPAAVVTIRDDGARVLSAQSEARACRIQGDADSHVRAWLESISIDLDAGVRRQSRPNPWR